ncbi:hypothetical protein GCM10009678_47550 [Actinomadura kijaniata]
MSLYSAWVVNSAWHRARPLTGSFSIQRTAALSTGSGGTGMKVAQQDLEVGLVETASDGGFLL